MSAVENAIKNHLQLKWVHARDLARQAKDNLSIRDNIDEPTNEQIIQEVSAIFAGLDPPEQAKMRAPVDGQAPATEGAVVEPEWRRKAREQAERRHQEWREENPSEGGTGSTGASRTKTMTVKRPTETTIRKKGHPIIKDAEKTSETTQTTTVTRTVVKSSVPSEDRGPVTQVKCFCTIL